MIVAPSSGGEQNPAYRPFRDVPLFLKSEFLALEREGLIFNGLKNMTSSIRKIFSITFVLIVITAAFACADEKPRPASAELPARKTLFVVETDDQSAVESLNRVAGEIDKGFIYSDDDASYKSSDQLSPSPFARQQQQDRSK